MVDDRNLTVLVPTIAASGLPAAPVLGLMAIGVLVAMGGHIARSRRWAATGIALLFLATLAMMVGAFVAYEDDSSDPRPRQAPGAGF